jgi:hypothetical protein
LTSHNGNASVTRKRGESHVGAYQPTDEVRRLLRSVERLDTTTTVAELLTKFMAARRKIKPGTRRSYQGHIDNRLVSHLGQYRADRLGVGHIDGMYEAIEERNERIRLHRAGPDPRKRYEVIGLRTIGPATMHRIRATLRAAYNWAIKRGMVEGNPAKYVELPAAKPPKALVWTDEWIDQWRRTGSRL